MLINENEKKFELNSVNSNDKFTCNGENLTNSQGDIKVQSTLISP